MMNQKEEAEILEQLITDGLDQMKETSGDILANGVTKMKETVGGILANGVAKMKETADLMNNDIEEFEKTADLLDEAATETMNKVGKVLEVVKKLKEDEDAKDDTELIILCVVLAIYLLHKLAKYMFKLDILEIIGRRLGFNPAAGGSNNNTFIGTEAEPFSIDLTVLEDAPNAGDHAHPDPGDPAQADHHGDRSHPAQPSHQDEDEQNRCYPTEHDGKFVYICQWFVYIFLYI